MVALLVDTAASLIKVGDAQYPCRIGRAGSCPAGDKREGDGRTPLGDWPLRTALLRPGTGFIPPTELPWRWLRPSDGWSDDLADPVYNRPVRHPHAHSAETLWREDGVYDAIVTLGHNDTPPLAGAGSAIFLHLAGQAATEGCVAVSGEVMTLLLARAKSGDRLVIG